MENNIPIVRKCPMCGKQHLITVDKAAYEKWQRGDASIQKCFPDLLPEEREVLKTGICPECWDNMFKEDDDDDEEDEKI